MNDIFDRIAKLSPEKRILLENKLRNEGISTELFKSINPVTQKAKIQKIKEKPYYRASAAQKRVYMLEQSMDCGTSYNIPIAIEIRGNLDLERVKKAVKDLIDRHESLRTQFDIFEGKIVQIVLNSVNFEIEYKDFSQDSGCEFIDNNENYEKLLHGFVKKFDLHRAPLFRLKLIRVKEESFILLLDIHHIISDGISMVIFLNDFARLYAGTHLIPLDIQYKDYAEMQYALEQTKRYSDMGNYWIKMFDKDIPVLNLPEDYQRPAQLDFDGCNTEILFPEALTSDIHDFLKRKNVTLFLMFLAVYNVLLSKLTCQEDIIIGIPSSNRGYEEVGGLVGMFVNTLAIRSFPKADKTFSEFLEETRIKWLDLYKIQDYQFEMLIEKIGAKRRPGRNILFDTILNVHSMETMDNLSEIEVDGICFKPVKMTETTSKFDIALYVSQSGKEIKVKCNYRSGIFVRETIEYILEEFKKLFIVILENPDINLEKYDIFNSHELMKIKDKRQDTGMVCCNDMCIVKKFEEMAEQYCDKTAVSGMREKLTYGQLNKKANVIANSIIYCFKQSYKRDVDTLKGERIALLFGHDTNMVAGVMGTLKTGGIYVPLDTAYPEDRLRRILSESQACITITDSANYALAKSLMQESENIIHLINIDTIEASDENPDISISGDDYAYIMYTSGSTGIPKGAVQNHRNINHFITEYIGLLDYDNKDNTALFTSYSHTVSVIDMFSALVSGGRLSIFDIKAEGSIEGLLQWINKERITVIHTVPALYRKVLKMHRDKDSFREIRLVILGGEAVYRKDVELYKRVFPDKCRFVNLFGSSELIIAASYIIDKETPVTRPCVPIGYPVAGVGIKLKNSNGEAARVFELGEIVFSSRYLSPGYYDTKQETGIRSLKGDNLEETGVYESGDFGKVLPDGAIEYFGRKDFQIKIRGNRVELNDIEYSIVSLPGIDRAVVRAYGNNENLYLAAFYETADKAPVKENVIKEYLRSQIPEYMIPSSYYHVIEFELTPNGKVDISKLPEPVPGLEGEYEYSAPKNELEAGLAAIWEDILEVGKISTDRSFFDVGGNSILAMTLYDSIKNKYMKELKVSDLFQYQSVSKLAEFIEFKRNKKKDIEFEERISSMFESLEKGTLSYDKAIEELLKRED